MCKNSTERGNIIIIIIICISIIIITTIIMHYSIQVSDDRWPDR